MSRTSTRSTTSTTSERASSAGRMSAGRRASIPWLPDFWKRTSKRCTAVEPAGISGMRTPGLTTPSSRRSIVTSRTGRRPSLRTATSSGTTTPAAGTPPTIAKRSSVRLPLPAPASAAPASAAQSTKRTSVPSVASCRTIATVSSADSHCAVRKSLTTQTTRVASVPAPSPRSSAAAARGASGPASEADGFIAASSSRIR